MRKRLLPLLLASLAAAAACGSGEEGGVGSSEAAHTEGEWIWKNEVHLWSVIDDDTFGRTFGPGVSKSDLLALRLQDWVDRYDAIVRDFVKEKSGVDMVAPKPRVQLLPNADVNAFIRFVPTCLTDPPARAGGGGSRDLVVLDRPSSMQKGGFVSSCVVSSAWGSEKSSIDWFNGLGGARIARTGDGFQITNGDLPATGASQVAVIAAAPYVNVYAGLVKNLDEKSTAVAIAHELGHYYRSHLSTAVSEKYDYWYDRPTHAAERPKPVENQSELRQEYDRLKVPRLTVKGQKIHPRLGSTMLAWATNLTVAAGHPCEPVMNAVRTMSPGIRSELFYGYDGGLSHDARNAYLDLDAKMASCIDVVTLNDDAQATPVVFQTTDMPRAFFLSRLDAAIAGAITQDTSSAKTLAELVDRLTAGAKKLDADAPEFLKRLTDNQIGYYTGEQEADDLAMELSARIGISPDETLRAFIELSRALERSMDAATFQQMNDGLTTEDCEKLLDAGFKDGETSVYVPLGTLYDPHHALCYRVFNLFREKAAHEYTTATPSFPEASPSWEDLQEHAKNLRAEPPPPTDGGSGSGSGDGDGDGDPTFPGGSGDPSEPGATGEPSAPGSSSSDGEPEESSAAPEEPGSVTTTHTTAGCSAAPVESSSETGAIGLALATALLTARRRRRPRER